MSAQQRRLQKVLGHITASEPVALAGNDCWAKDEDYTRSKLNTSTMDSERANASFDVRELSYLLDGGKEMTEWKERVMREIERDPVFRYDDSYEISRDEQRKRTLEKIRRSLLYFREEAGDQRKNHVRSGLFSLLEPSHETRMGVHFYLFKPAVENNGTPEQAAKWGEDALMCRILGCFAMTELGTGSNVPGIQTTATYDKEKQQFIINTPNLQATKWWIGGAADTATHAVVFARLILEGMDFGPNIFVVQLRDLKDHTLMPGVSIGDCGSKMGRQGVDNGWIQFSNVKIPRTQMLMRFSEVTPEGEFRLNGDPQSAYSALIGGRVSMVATSAMVLQQAITVAVRYAAVRRQFPTKRGQPDNQILNYATHEYRLMPLLAAAYAVHFTSERLDEKFNHAVDQMKQNEFGPVKELHPTSAGLKAFCTWMTHYALDEMRQSMGGHGYSKYAGLSDSFNDFAVMCTWEGDNTVLAQQTARYMIKSLQAGMAGKPLPSSVSYLKLAPTLLGSTSSVSSEADLLNPATQMQLFQYVAIKLIADAGQLLQAKIQNEKMPQRVAWNATTVELNRAAKAHTYLFIIESFMEHVNAAQRDDLKAALKMLCDLFVLYHLEQNLAVLLEDGFFTASHAKMLKQVVMSLCHKVRTQAVPLVDAFNLSDFFIRSPLGRYDGNIYENYFNFVKTQTPARTQPSYYNEVIQPLLQHGVERPDNVKI